MRFGFNVPNHGGSIATEDQVGSAELADQLGFDSVWAADHIIVPSQYSGEYGYVNEALTTLAYIGGRTERVRLGTSVIVMPQREPILLAKQLSTIANLSGGRAILGVGVGWLEGEFKLLGAQTFRRRGAILNEAIPLMKKLWTEDVVEFKGKFFSVSDGVFLPKPGNIPVWIGGRSDAAIERAVSLGDAWYPLWIEPHTLREGVEKLRRRGERTLVSLGMQVDMRRNRSLIVRTSGTRMHQLAGPPAKIAKGIEEYVDAGMQYMVVGFDVQNGTELLEDMRTFSKEVMSSFA